MYTLDSLKKKTSNIDHLTKEIDKLQNPYEKSDDDRFWKLTVDKAGNGQAVFRFLPTPPEDGEEGVPFVRYWSHGFQGKSGKWYIENSRNSIGDADPCSEYNSWLWENHAEGSPERKWVSEHTKRRLHYVSNIYMIDDKANPANNGKVFLYKYGVKIFAKIHSKLHPEFEGDDKINVFDPFKGADFDLRAVKVSGQRNYDQSVFKPVSELAGGDTDKILEVCNSAHSLQEFLKPEFYKSREELLKNLDRVYGFSTQEKIHGGKPAVAETMTDSDGVVQDDPPFDVENNEPDLEDTDLEYFKNLAD